MWLKYLRKVLADITGKEISYDGCAAVLCPVELKVITYSLTIKLRGEVQEFDFNFKVLQS